MIRSQGAPLERAELSLGSPVRRKALRKVGFFSSEPARSSGRLVGMLLASFATACGGSEEQQRTVGEDAAGGGASGGADGAPAGGSASTGGASVGSGAASSGGTGAAAQTGGTLGSGGNADPEHGSGGAPGGGVSGSGGAESGGSSSGGGAGTGGGAAFVGKELFILFGQSNMSGMSPLPTEPWPLDERVTFMVQYDCSRLGQTKDEWLVAEPPLHGCQWATGGIGLGLADFFGASLAEAWPDAEIGLIPNAIPAVTIEIFTKGGPSPGDGMKALPDGYESAYALMVDRAKEAQQLGRVRGILMHQGESDINQGLEDQWLDRLSSVVADLRSDLGLGEEVPFIAGEISPSSNYSGINPYVNQIPDVIPNSGVVSAEGTQIHDVAHFDLASAQLMGERYTQKLLELIGP